MKTLACIALSFLLSVSAFAQELRSPSFEEVISLQSASDISISPDGTQLLFEVNSVDWENNRFDTEIWMARAGENPFPLTHNEDNSSSSPQWSPDGKWIAFLANKSGKTQIQLIRAAGGESFQLTSTDKNISDFEWSPDGSQIMFLQPEDKDKEEKDKKKKYGDYEVEDEEYLLNRLWITEFDPASFTSTKLPEDSTEKEQTRIFLDSVDYSIRSFAWAPDGKSIAIEHAPTSQLLDFFKADISLLDTATKELHPLVANKSSENLIAWSPDGSAILYGTYLDDTTSNFYKNFKLFRIDIDGSDEQQLADNFDENLYAQEWTPQGIFATAYQKTKRPLYHIDPSSGKVSTVLTTPDRVYGIDASEDGTKLAFGGGTDHGLSEIYTVSSEGKGLRKISSFSDQISDWKTSDSEVISWQSDDGATIEGILHKPQDYDPERQYPLLVVIHGGPTGISIPDPTPAYVYPMLQWLNKGALVMMPNYRGSAGYGEAFRSLNVRNLGVGDAWDVLSGVKYLEEKGIINKDSLGAMGWSQGGYISAFLTTHSDKFKAISVGAGISDWETYYVSTDIHPFTRQYLKATPWDDPEIYVKTSPMSAIREASTPTLIQHGEFDKRVPISNAYELYQGLQDVGVTTKLIVYKGFGHGITKPKERLAAMWHNWAWFSKYLWGEDITIPME